MPPPAFVQTVWQTVTHTADVHNEYVRSALKLGLAQQTQLGVNPFKFGLVGSNDAHTSLSTVDENNFWGSLSKYEPSAERVTSHWSKAAGALPTWRVVWQDPDFKPEQPAFYYVRTLEIPTLRWTAYDAKAFALKDLPQPMTQERAYSSPVWYTPMR